jgi:hypothetical protein
MKRDKYDFSGITDDMRSVFEATRGEYTENPYLLSGLRHALRQNKGSEFGDLADRYWIYSLISGATVSVATACMFPVIVSGMITASFSVSCDPLFINLLAW